MEISRTCPRHFYDDSGNKFQLANVFPTSGKVSPGLSSIDFTIVNSSDYLAKFLPSTIESSINSDNIDKFANYATIVISFYTTHDIALTGNEHALDIKIDSTTIIEVLNSSEGAITIYKANIMYQWKIYIAKKSENIFSFISNSSFINSSGALINIPINSATSSFITLLQIVNAAGKTILNKFRFVNIELYTTNMTAIQAYYNCWPGCNSCDNNNTCLDDSYSLITNGENEDLEYFNFAATTSTAQNTMVEVELTPPTKANGYTLGFWVFYSKAKSTVASIADYYVNVEADDIIQAKISRSGSPLKLNIEPKILGVTYTEETKSNVNWLNQWVHVKVGYLENRKYTHNDMLDSFIAINHKDGEEKSDLSTRFFLTSSDEIEKPFSRIWDNNEKFTFKITRNVSLNSLDQIEIYIRELAIFDTYLRTPFQNL